MTNSVCFNPKSNTVNKFPLSMPFFAHPLLPLIQRTTCSEYMACFMSWHQELWLFYTHPIHDHLFIIMSSVKLGMEVYVLRAGGSESHDSHSWKTGQYGLRGWYCHIWCVLYSDFSEVPLWTHPGDFCCFFFPWKRYISDKQEPGTEGTFLEFCCLKQNNKKYVSFVVVLDEQLLIYVLEKVQRSRSFWKGF